MDLRFGDLRGLLAAQPFLAGKSAPLYVLHHRLEHAPEPGQYVQYAIDHGLEAVWPPDRP